MIDNTYVDGEAAQGLMKNLRLNYRLSRVSKYVVVSTVFSHISHCSEY